MDSSTITSDQEVDLLQWSIKKVKMKEPEVATDMDQDCNGGKVEPCPYKDNLLGHEGLILLEDIMEEQDEEKKLLEDKFYRET